jgi:hypothetical protein
MSRWFGLCNLVSLGKLESEGARRDLSWSPYQGNDEVFLVPYGQEQNWLVEWKIATYFEMVIYGYALFGWEGPTILGEIFYVCSIYTKSLAHWCPTMPSMPGMTKNPMFPTCVFFCSIIPKVCGGVRSDDNSSAVC